LLLVTLDKDSGCLYLSCLCRWKLAAWRED